MCTSLCRSDRRLSLCLVLYRMRLSSWCTRTQYSWTTLNGRSFMVSTDWISWETVTTLIIHAIHLMEWKAVLSRNAFLLEIPHLYAVAASHYGSRSCHISRYYRDRSSKERRETCHVPATQTFKRAFSHWSNNSEHM